jgi:hypothetical protein
MKLLDTSGGNPKLRKTAMADGVRIAGLSLFPDSILCPGSKAAGCREPCLVKQGRGVFPNVRESRKRKANFFHSNQSEFLEALRNELFKFAKVCRKDSVAGWVRLNVLSDIDWPRLGIPQEFKSQGLNFYDYCKVAKRLTSKMNPSNYHLIFSYSGRKEYTNQVKLALKTDFPIAVVFRGGFPTRFLDRPVCDGDVSDYQNVFSRGCVVALKAKGTARFDRSGFVVDNPDLLAIA